MFSAPSKIKNRNTCIEARASFLDMNLTVDTAKISAWIIKYTTNGYVLSWQGGNRVLKVVDHPRM
jgi:hypothetical protein